MKNVIIQQDLPKIKLLVDQNLKLKILWQIISFSLLINLLMLTHKCFRNNSLKDKNIYKRMDQIQILVLQIKITFLLMLNFKIYFFNQLNIILRIILLIKELLKFQLKIFRLMIVGMDFSHKAVNLILSDLKKKKQ